ncbi:spore protease [Desulfitispora alkaliphila]|uniref:GPR endopeptidase n=1 Tax=Desulfitispora alkaliphila TaxID=622674 RepID=UPI003D21ADB0
MRRDDIYKKYSIQLDLAVEAEEAVRGETGQEISGVTQEVITHDKAKINRIEVTDKHAEKLMNKPMGNYITIDAPEIKTNNKQVHDEISSLLALELERLIKIDESQTVLIVGLGNWHATPDALGPKVVSHVLVTRHLGDHAPAELTQGLRPVCALSPGVLGITGIETAEIIKGVVDKVNPSLVIAIDALASRSVKRIGTTIQIADTGINPGSGIGNKRIGINKDSIGVPVIAVGIPTVVNAAIIAHDTVEALITELAPTIPDIEDNVTSEKIAKSIDYVLSNFAKQLMVTPKEIDELTENSSKIIASSLTQALQPEISSDANYLYLQ